MKKKNHPKLTDTQILDFLNRIKVDTIYLDTYEIIDVRGGDIRAAVRAVYSRPRCEKCARLLEEHQVKDGYCNECKREESEVAA